MSDVTLLDRISLAIRAFIRAEVESLGLGFVGVFEYEVIRTSGAPPSVLIDARCLNQSLGLPDVNNCPMHPSIAGITSIPDVGVTCRIHFVNRDPSRAEVIGVGSLGVLPIARLGDQVTVFLPPTLPVTGLVNVSTPFAGTITIPAPVTGVITQGSGKMYGG